MVSGPHLEGEIEGTAAECALTQPAWSIRARVIESIASWIAVSQWSVEHTAVIALRAGDYDGHLFPYLNGTGRLSSNERRIMRLVGERGAEGKDCRSSWVNTPLSLVVIVWASFC